MRVLVQAQVVFAELADERTHFADLAGAHFVDLPVAEWTAYRCFHHWKV